MFNRQVAFLILFIFQLNSAISQQKKYVDGNRIKEYISIIASDSFEGRETGTDGCIKTENFFAEKFKALGLKPAGGNNSFYNSYTIPFYKLEGDFDLLIAGRKYYFGSDEDFNIERNSEGGIAEGKIVFAGYGIHAPEIGRDDYANLNLKDKIVLIKEGIPNSEPNKFDKYASDSTKAEYCYKSGAKGILFFETPVQRNMQIPFSGRAYGSLANDNRIKNFPVFKVEYNIVRQIFEKAPITITAAMRQIEKEPASFESDISGKMSAKITFDPYRGTRNVLAMIPGTDSKLKNEAIIIGGHMDHLGKRYDGTVYNGANDNASGVCVTLGIAEAMMKNKFKPKRTIIFACWSGEEKGLLGSSAWVKNPTWDLNKIVVYFNLDMVGLGDGKLNMPGIFYADEIWNFLKENLDTSYLAKINPAKGGLGGSDHTPFLKKGVPAFAGMTSGDHSGYHQPEDDVEKINANILQTVGDLIYKSTELISNQKMSFIAQNREREIKFKLTPLRNLAALDLEKYETALKNKNISLSLVNIGANITGSSVENNFIDVLKSLEDIYSDKKIDKNYRFVYNFSSDRNRERISLMAALNLSTINYNELYAKVLSRSNLKIGIINNDFFQQVSKSERIPFINNITESGMAILLNNIDSDQLLQIAKESNKSLGIITSDPGILNDDLCQSVKSKGHLIIYKFKASDKIDSIIVSIHEIKNKLNERQVCLMPEEFNDQSYNRLKEIFFSLDKENASEDFTNRLFGNSFMEFMMKTINIAPETRNRR